MPGENDAEHYNCDYEEKEFKNFELLNSDFIMSDFSKKKFLTFRFKKKIESKNFISYNSISSVPNTISKEQYLNLCNEVIHAIRKGQFEKVVLSRVIALPINKELTEIFESLCSSYPDAFIYMVSTEKNGTWLGASPEVLLEYDQKTIKTTALAGTKFLQSTPWGDKEKEEQQIVSDFIKLSLENSGVKNIRLTPTYTLYTGSVYHIKNDFTGTLSTGNISSLITNLHPTPATCGIPQRETQSFISSIESHNRSFYTGFLGPTSTQNAHFFVNLRCLQIIDNTGYIYVGGGITKDSNPESEWQETIKKSETLSKFLA